ncbi:MAG: AAA family ATPase [Nitrospirae bacterium]|nr:AAA family ATPase [Nitrospirota bacterium]
MTRDSVYELHWGLRLRPFENVPDPKFYVASAKHEAAMERMLYGIHARKGIVMLTGEIGSGKTLLSRAVILKLPRSRYEIGLVSNPTILGSEFLGEILFQLGLDPHGTRVEQLRRLNDQLLANYHRDVDTVVVVDEAQAIEHDRFIEHDRLFEELRLLSNFQLNDRFLITLVLVGQPELRERITRIPQLAQRVAIQHHIDYLDRAETKAYILARLAAAGSNFGIFSPRAISSIYHRTGGVCRLINSLCDLCLYFGHVSGARQIRRALVEKVGNELLHRPENTGARVIS